jgi:hypothetical protein
MSGPIGGLIRVRKAERCALPDMSLRPPATTKATKLAIIGYRDHLFHEEQTDGRRTPSWREWD